MGIVEILTGVSDLKRRGVALLFSMKANQPALCSLLDRLAEGGVPAFLLFAEGQIRQSGNLLTAHQTKLKKPQLQALLAQATGHMLGRVIRLKLIERQGSDRTCDISNPTQFLVNFDLAQRRRLNARATHA